MRVIYAGNISAIAESLDRNPLVKLAGWIVEEEDFVQSAVTCHRVKSKSDIQNVLNKIGPIDLGIIANFGIILSEEILEAAPLGFINAHLGLLPNYPGRHPIKDAIKNKEPFTGVTLHQATHLVDQGPIISQKIISMGKNPQPHRILERLELLALEMIELYLKKNPTTKTNALVFL